MKDEQIKEILQTELSKMPSSNFNHLVLSAILQKEKNRRSHYIPFDEPFIIGIMILGMLVLSFMLLYGNPKKMDSSSGYSNIYLIVLLCSFIPIFIIAMNTITVKIMRHKSKA